MVKIFLHVFITYMFFQFLYSVISSLTLPLQEWDSLFFEVELEGELVNIE